MNNLEEISRKLDLVIPKMQMVADGFEKLLNGLTIPRMPTKQDLVSGGTQTYEIKEFDLASARTDEEVLVEGTYVHAWTDGYLNGVGVRFNQKQNGLCYFDQRNPYPGPFYKLYLTNTAQTNKTLTLFIGKGSMMEGLTNLSGIWSPQFIILKTAPVSYFTDQLAQYATEMEDVPGLIVNKLKIVGVSIISSQNLHYRLLFFDAISAPSSYYITEHFLGSVDLDIPTFGYQMDGSGQYLLDVQGIDINYENAAGVDSLHVKLQNLSVETKQPYTDGVLLGAIADDGGVQTDETAAANNAAANDMTLLPAAPAVNDAYYFGAYGVFDKLNLNIGTQGAGDWTITWEYSNNAGGWTALTASIYTDTIDHFRGAAGIKTIEFNEPISTWARQAVNGITAFWIRARVSAFVNIVTQPLGTQAWIEDEAVKIIFTYEPRG